MSFTINQAALKPQMQDLGITGLKHLGVSTGGAMDGYAYHCANALLHNDSHAPAIEVALGMFSMTANAPTVIAVCGADLGLTINGIAMLNWCCHSINTGDTIKFTGGNSGTRAYVAVKGGFDTPQFFGSASTVERLNIGRILEVGDTLDFHPTEDIRKYRNIGVPRIHIPNYNAPLCLDVVVGYQCDNFDLHPFWHSPYTVTPSQNRMGYILEGTPIPYHGTELLSEGISMGAIQIPPDGKPIVLMSDGQSIGGYPKVGALASYSRWALSQCSNGKTVTFQPVTPDDALAGLDKLLSIKL